MAKTPRIINVGKSHLVYKGEVYKVVNDRVEKHTPKLGLPARKKPQDLNQVIAVYSEILHNDLSLSHHQQMMDKAEVKQALAEAKRKKKKISELTLRQAAKAEAILKTEFHNLESPEPPANPLFRERDSRIYKLFIALSPVALYGQAFVLWWAAQQDTANWFISASQPLVLAVVIIIYLAVVIHVIYWLFSVTAELKQAEEIDFNFPSPWSYTLIVIPIFGILVWMLSAGRFIRHLNKLIGRTKAGFNLGLLFVLVLPLSHISILYFQRRLNILDKNKMSFLIA